MSEIAAHYEIKKTKNGQFHFVLIAPNGKIILQSETYTTKQNAINGIESIRINAGTLNISDKSKN